MSLTTCSWTDSFSDAYLRSCHLERRQTSVVLFTYLWYIQNHSYRNAPSVYISRYTRLLWFWVALGVFSSRRTNEQDLGFEEQTCFQGVVHSFDWLRAWPRFWSSFFSCFQASWSLVHLPWKIACWQREMKYLD